MSKFATYEKVEEFYNAMYEFSEKDKHGRQVYTGYTTTELWVYELGYTRNDPSYSHTIYSLKTCGFAEQERSGTKSTPSVWILIEKPSMEKYKFYKSLINKEAKLTLIDRLNKMNENLTKIMGEVQIIQNSMIDIEERLMLLEEIYAKT